MSNVRLAVIYYRTYGTSVTVGGEGLTDEICAAIRAQSKRLVTFADAIAKCGEPGNLKVK